MSTSAPVKRIINIPIKEPSTPQPTKIPLPEKEPVKEK